MAPAEPRESLQIDKLGTLGTLKPPCLRRPGQHPPYLKPPCLREEIPMKQFRQPTTGAPLRTIPKPRPSLRPDVQRFVKMTVSELTRALEAGEADRSVNQVLQAEIEGRNRRGAVDALRARVATLRTPPGS